RFLGAFAEGEGFEAIDLFADVGIVASAELNRHSGYDGTVDVAAWSRGDAILALSFWGYGGVYAQQTLIDGPGRGNATLSCHGCQGIGVELRINFNAGLLTWARDERGWASLYEPMGAKPSPELLSQLGTRYLFDAPAIWNSLGYSPDFVDGSAWRLGDDLRLSHACNCDADYIREYRQDEFKRLALRRVEHHGRTVDTRTPVQLADARLMITRAVSGSMELARTRNVWQRLSDLGVLVSVASRSEIAVQSFSYDAVFKNPSLVTEPMVRSLPAIRQIFESPSGP